MKKESRIFVTGHKGLVGSAIVRRLKADGYFNIITIDRNNCDLRSTAMTHAFFESSKPEYVINCAGTVGGIHANNTMGGAFIYDNLMVQTNVIEAARTHSVTKLINLGSSCVYPKHCPQPIKEEYLLSDYLEKTNIGYAIAKIAAITMCQEYKKQYGCDFISVMPTNLYGVGDNFHKDYSHVLPSIIRKLHEAKINNIKTVEFWGDGSPKREFLFVDDLADALLFLMNNYDDEAPINIGTGSDISIKEAIAIISDIIGYGGDITWSSYYPNGTPMKRLDVDKINSLGWSATTSFRDGVKDTYAWFVKNYPNIRM